MVACFAGIDVGSLSTDAVILDGRGQLVGSAVLSTGAHSSETARAALQEALEAAGLSNDAISGSVGTGYGRVSLDFVDRTVTEIACHARGAAHLFEDCATVIDIGGQDSKVIRTARGGKVIDFAMNDKCAAGTGRFLEVMASKLEVQLDDLGALSSAAVSESTISSVCTVFAESEIVSLVSQNEPREAIVRGLHRSIARRVASMAQSVGVVGPVIMTGGVAKNVGVVALLAEELGERPLIPDEPQLTGALGAALIASGGGGPNA